MKLSAHACAFMVGAGLTMATYDLTLAGAAAGQNAATGTLSGVVRLTAAKGASAASAYDRRSVGPRAKALTETGNVVVFFEGVSAPGGVKATPVAIVQKDEQFVPHVIAVTAGSVVDFPNQDPFFHNVFSLSKPATFDLGRFPPEIGRASCRERV